MWSLRTGARLQGATAGAVRIRKSKKVFPIFKKPLLGSLLQANCICSVIVKMDADGMWKLREYTVKSEIKPQAQERL